LAAALLERMASIQGALKTQDNQMLAAAQELGAAGQQQRAAVNAVERKSMVAQLQLSDAAEELQAELEVTQSRLSRAQLLLNDAKTKLTTTEATSQSLLMYLLHLGQKKAAAAASLQAATLENVSLMAGKLRLDHCVAGLELTLDTVTQQEVGRGPAWVSECVLYDRGVKQWVVRARRESI